jgi:hypothetical protein
MTFFLILAVLLPWSLSRQMRPHRVTSQGLVKLPAIFALIGLSALSGTELPAGGGAVAYVGASVLITVVFGVWRGLAMPVWFDAGWMSQGDRRTISLWVAMIALKVAVGVVAGVAGFIPSETVGELFLFLAASFAVQNVIIARRTVLRAPAGVVA